MKKGKLWLLILAAATLTSVLQCCDYGVNIESSPYVIQHMELFEGTDMVEYTAYSVNRTEFKQILRSSYIRFIDSAKKYNYGDTVAIVKKGN